MPNEHVLRLIRLVNLHPVGLTAAYDVDTDRLQVEFADFPFSPQTGVLRASEASDDQLHEAIRRLVHC